jgi:predicted Fe-Mo cluster-binding NifX family protein
VKIGIRALGESLDSPVDQRFGRTRFFILFDSEKEEWSVYDNKRNVDAAQGAGIQAAQRIVELGAEALATGHCGPNAFATLTNAGIEVYQDAKGAVCDVLEAYREGRLQKSDTANVKAGFGTETVEQTSHD